MGDETGLRPKAGKQREEPPDTDWVRHRQNWAEQTKEGCGWVSGGPTLHTLVSRTVLIDIPLTGARRFESQSSNSTVPAVLFVVWLHGSRSGSGTAGHFC